MTDPDLMAVVGFKRITRCEKATQHTRVDGQGAEGHRVEALPGVELETMADQLDRGIVSDIDGRAKRATIQSQAGVRADVEGAGAASIPGYGCAGMGIGQGEVVCLHREQA